jgi:NAD+ diphosphatase
MNTFTSLMIDRASRRRRDDAWVAERSEDPATRFLPVWGSKVLVTGIGDIPGESTPHPIQLSPEEAGEHLRQAESVILLGEDEEHAYFALGLRPSDGPPPTGLAEIGAFRRLRAVAPLLDGESAALLAYAKAMVHYHHQHRFCPTCGAPTKSKEGGHLRVCTNAGCGQHDFPRTDPAIIVLVSSGERCLLGRQPTWPENLYSIIAGFVEPGENLEDAVAREVREETGIRIRHIRYHSSQPWPFPRSLMVGFTATAESTTIRLNDGELADARWLSREEIEWELKRGTLRLPSSISISRRLIETWFDAGSSVALRRILRPA